jgi:ABC-2 type transport system ATP-binding protein
LYIHESNFQIFVTIFRPNLVLVVDATNTPAVDRTECTESLMALGFTALEAEVYAALVQQSPATAYKLAQEVGKAAANVYKAVEALQRKGAIIVEDSSNRLYRAVPPGELIQQLEHQFIDARDRAQTALSRLSQPPSDERVYQISSVEQVITKAQVMLRTAKQKVLCDLFPQAAILLHDDIEQAAQRGCEVLVQVYQPIEFTKKVQVFVRVDGERLIQVWPGEWLNLVADAREHLLAFLHPKLRGVHQAVWSESMYLSLLYYSGLCSEMTAGALIAELKAGSSSDVVYQKAQELHLAFKGTHLPGYQSLLRGFRVEPEALSAEQQNPSSQPVRKKTPKAGRTRKLKIMLQIQALTKVYPGPIAALTDVSLEIPTGMFGLLGPNGAGKSTLMKIITGLLEPTSGSVYLDSIDIQQKPDYLRSRLGYLPQDFGFYPHLSGRKMLEFLLEMKGIGTRKLVREHAEQLLHQVNLTQAAERKVSTYSGGMRQRLGFAQAIAGDPRLIVVDEPTAGLDPQERQRMYRLLSELANQRIVILSTHLVEDVSVLCPQFALLRAGRVVQITSPSKARESLQGHIFEGQLSGQALSEMYESHTVTQAFLVEGKMHVRLYLVDQDPPSGFTQANPTLEDAFVLMMSERSQLVPGSGKQVLVDIHPTSQG